MKRTYIHACKNKSAYTRTRTHTHTRTYTHIYPYTYSYSYPYLYPCPHPTRTHTHTRTYELALIKRRYIDLGSGTGAAAIRLASKYSTVSVNALNLCDKQNKIATDNAAAAGISERMTVTTGILHLIHLYMYTVKYTQT